MADDSGRDMFAPFRASIRNHLGELADEIMRGKITLARKISAHIETETDVEKLKELRNELTDLLLSDEDVARVDARLTKLLEAIKRHADMAKQIRNILVMGH